MSKNILKDVATRTSGEIYIGVVGPVRSGKSTFIRRFMEVKVLPLVENKDIHDKIQDELPQSGEGKMITTVEPKFIPTTQVKISIEDNLNFQVRLVDCVGHIIESAKGYLNDDGSSRLVQTPWFSEAIPFEEAAKIGTDKVIESHSNIGIVLSSDGSFGEFNREEYEKVEEKIIDELKQLNKPFILVINTIVPNNQETLALVKSLEEKYGVSVVAIDVQNMSENDIDKILKLSMDEFDIKELNIDVPTWINKLTPDISYKEKFNQVLSSTTGEFRKMKDAFRIQDSFVSSGLFDNVDITDVDSATGVVSFELGCSEEAYHKVLSEIIGHDVDEKDVFIESLISLNKAKKVYEVIGDSIEKVDNIGYDITLPKQSDIIFDKPSLLKDGSRYGIKITANAPIVQLVKVNVTSSFEPIIGTKEQAEELMNHMLDNFENDPEKLWNSEVFGRKLYDVINDGIKSKINSIPNDVLEKYKNSMEKVINNGKGGVIAIIL